MAYVLNYSVTVSWVGDGVGQLQPGPAAPLLTVGAGGNFGSGGAAGGPVQVPGGDAPSTGNISTACTTMATNAAAALNAQIGRIQGWANGSTQ